MNDRKNIFILSTIILSSWWIASIFSVLALWFILEVYSFSLCSLNFIIHLLSRLNNVLILRYLNLHWHISLVFSHESISIPICLLIQLLLPLLIPFLILHSWQLILFICILPCWWSPSEMPTLAVRASAFYWSFDFHELLFLFFLH